MCTKTPVAFCRGLFAFKRPRCVDDGADDDDGDDKSLEKSSRKTDICWAPSGSQRIDGKGAISAEAIQPCRNTSGVSFTRRGVGYFC